MIYVITRTNKRPNKFKVCQESVAIQSVVCKHVTISEDNLPQYLEDFEGDSIVLPKNSFKHYNNYLDWAFANIGEPDDYFMCLDDDDFLLWGDSLETALKEGKEADLIIWRVNSAVGIVPTIDQVEQKKVIECSISGIGFLIKKKVIKNARFGDATLGDYRFLNTANQENESVWIPNVLTSTNPFDKFGGGNERDMDYNQAKKGFNIARAQLKLMK